MTRSFRLLAAILPLAGLAGLWAMSAKTYSEGTAWEVPIQGYDPRDYLRGHYVEFTYDWPGEVGLSDLAWSAMCLEGEAPNIARARWLRTDEACDHPVRADSGGVYAGRSLTVGRLYIGQDRAAQLQEQLQNRDQRGIVTIRQREDGSFTPVSIRFRPLTPEEIAERDAQNEGAGDLRPPPPIMSQ